MNITFLGISWGAFENAQYFAVVVFAFIMLLFRFFKIKKQARLLVSAKHLKTIFSGHSSFRQSIKMILFSIGLSFLVLSLMKPQWDKKEQTVSQEGRDLLIAIDVSRSMLAKDVKPNRLEFAKEKIKKLLYNLSCERVGLILFSGSTIVQCPLTTDYSSFLMFLDQLDIDTISSGTTALDQAIKESLRVFESMPTKKTKIMVAFTDGEDFSSDLAGVKDRVVENGLSIFTVGVGTPQGAPVPILNNKGEQIGFEKDAQGNIIMSRLNEGVLMNLAQQSGGRYLLAENSDQDIKTLIRAVEKFEKDSFEDKMIGALQEQYPYFVAVSFLSFALEWIL